MGFFFIWLICAVACAFIATAKGHSGIGWFFGGLFLGPLGLLIIGFLPKVQSNIEDRQLQLREFKKCPQCAELVRYEAKICRFCNYKFEEVEAKLILTGSPPDSTKIETSVDESSKKLEALELPKVKDNAFSLLFLVVMFMVIVVIIGIVYIGIRSSH